MKNQATEVREDEQRKMMVDVLIEALHDWGQPQQSTPPFRVMSTVEFLWEWEHIYRRLPPWTFPDLGTRIAWEMLGDEEPDQSD